MTTNSLAVTGTTQRAGPNALSKNVAGTASAAVAADSSSAPPSGSTAELIAAQRAAFLSATRNSEQGVDITLNDHTTIRSKRITGADSYRYSYIDPAGAEFDISEVMESEWSPVNSLSHSPAASGDHRPRLGKKNSGPERLGGLSSQTSISSMTDDGYASAPESPVIPGKRAESPAAYESREDEDAIEALRLAPLAIDQATSPGTSKAMIVASPVDARDNRRRDLLVAALDKQKALGVTQTQSLAAVDSAKSGTVSSTSPSISSEPLERRIERVLAKVKANGSSGTRARSTQSIKPSNTTHRSESLDKQPLVSGRVPGSGTPSTTSQASRSVTSLNPSQTISSIVAPSSITKQNDTGTLNLTHSRAPSIDQILSSQLISKAQPHLQGSLTSVASSRSNSTTGSNSPVTPVTATSPTGESTYTPISSATRGVGIDSRQSTHRNPIVYRDDFGLDVLMNLIQHFAFPQSANLTERGQSSQSHLRYGVNPQSVVAGEAVTPNRLDNQPSNDMVRASDQHNEEEYRTQESLIEELFGPRRTLEEDPSISNEVKRWYQLPTSSNEPGGLQSGIRASAPKSVTECLDGLEDRLDRLMMDLIDE